MNPEIEPKPTDVVAKYHVTPKPPFELRESVQLMAEEASIGPWNVFWKSNENIGRELSPSMLAMNRGTNICKIGFPQTLFELRSIPQILSILMGNISGMKIIESVQLIDFHLTKELLESFNGPRFGLHGLRDLTQTTSRPLCGMVLKPKIGLDPESYATLAFESWMGGTDIIHDPETLTDLRGNSFDERIEQTITMKKKAEKETHEIKLYFPNITAPTTQQMIRRAEKVAEKGNEGVMINPLLSGWSSITSVAEACDSLGLYLMGNRTGHGFHSHQSHGIGQLALAKLFRLSGLDMIHISNPYQSQNTRLFVHIYNTLSDHSLPLQQEQVPKRPHHSPHQQWAHLKPCFPIISGGIHSGLLEPICSLLGTDILLVASEGILYHPKGIRAGAASIRQACDAIAQHIPVREYAQSHPELHMALEKWEKTGSP